jgi:tritrans,polycis-undecaprenyl-diphosphate synthase [geranylgeranyl-diphosphate specific]
MLIQSQRSGSGHLTRGTAITEEDKNIRGLNNVLRKTLYYGYERLLTGEVGKHGMPRHVAVIMDGNRRYADRVRIVRYYGHIYGARTTEHFLEWCWELGIRQTTIYAFSTENFSRPEPEREKIFEIIAKKLGELAEDPRTHERRMKVSAIGETHLLPAHLQDAIRRVEDVTCNYDGLRLNIAVAYGGQREILDAVQDMARKVRAGKLRADDIDESVVSRHLYTNGVADSDVDLIIRTGGDIRTSNFLPWQANGSECAAYFCAPFWPEFRKIDFLRAIRVYQTREHEQKQSALIRTANMLAACGSAEVGDVVSHLKGANRHRH